MDKLVSIVLPVYNGERYLKESIESVLAQTYGNWELLVLDDCSQDSSAKIIKEYAIKDNRIRYYKNAHNLKLPRNLNKGFSLAKGEYLTWTSDDNRYHPEALERMVTILNMHPEAGFVFASCQIIDDFGEKVDYIMVSSESPKWVVGVNSVGACFMYTRDVYSQIGEYDPELVLVEDYDYWQRICSSFCAIGIKDILYDYRWHAGALTSTMKKDLFYRNLEKTLLKNRPRFGKISIHQNYLYYRSLNNCRTGKKDNPYRCRYLLLTIENIVLYRLPKKIGRVAQKMKRNK